jgi:glycosyltransferase involved in cell wall biosynthesis
MKVSVIIPVYNAEESLESAISSALLQPEVRQLLLVNDQSTDRSPEICARWLGIDDRVQVLQTAKAGADQGRGGAAVARNLGLRHVNQPFVAFLDADDYYLKGRFREDKILFSRYPKAIGVWNSTEIRTWNRQDLQVYNGLFRHGMMLGYAMSFQKVDVTKMFRANGIHLNGITVKTHFLATIGYFDESLRQGQDIEFLYRLMMKGDLYSSDQSKAKAIYNIHRNNTIFHAGEALLYREKLYKKLFFMALGYGSFLLCWKFLFLYAEYHHLRRHGESKRNKKVTKLLHFPAVIYSLLFKNEETHALREYIPVV